MIANNHRAMMRIRDLAKHPLTLEGILEVHSILVDGTLAIPDQAGRFQTEADERIVVWDALSQTVLHKPPPAKELPERMAQLVAFANDDDIVGNRYLHPIIRSILLHFQLGFIHPFGDGNGRTARALFYWSMLAAVWLTGSCLSPPVARSPRGLRRSFSPRGDGRTGRDIFRSAPIERVRRSHRGF
ncbi:MAG: Fic family protein [Ahniella sp.]|nr:Fic family protein [Ahniella sp.]